MCTIDKAHLRLSNSARVFLKPRSDNMFGKHRQHCRPAGASWGAGSCRRQYAENSFWENVVRQWKAGGDHACELNWSGEAASRGRALPC